MKEARFVDVELIYEGICSFMRDNSDPSVAAKYSKYFIEGYEPYGVDPMLLKRKVLEAKSSGLSMDEALQLCSRLVSSGRYEEGHFAISLIKLFERQYTAQIFTEVSSWFDIGIRNWAHDDSLCLDILSVFVTRGIIPLEAISAWRSSELKYKRRAIPVSLIKSIDNPYSAEEIIGAVRPLMTDSEKVVQQGTGWLLREMWKKHPESVEVLLMECRQTGERVIYQYATEKMTPEQKERFRREKRAR